MSAGGLPVTLARVLVALATMFARAKVVATMCGPARVLVALATMFARAKVVATMCGPARVLVALATMFAVGGVALVPVLTPWSIHAGLDYGHSHHWKLFPAQNRTWSDATMHDFVFGGPFDILSAGGYPIYTPDEIAYLEIVRGHARLAVVAGVVALVVALVLVRLARDRRGILRAAAAGAGVVAVGVLVARGALTVTGWDFPTLFDRTHTVFFPAGTYHFDEYVSVLRQLYSDGFWQYIVTRTGGSMLALAVLTTAGALLAARRVGRHEKGGGSHV